MTIREWQNQLRARHEVWVVLVHGDETGNYYESEAAARIEVDYRLARGEKTARAVLVGNLHDVELARVRWGGELVRSGT